MTPTEYVQNIHAHQNCTMYIDGISGKPCILYEGMYYTYTAFNEAFPVHVIEVRQKVDMKKVNPDTRGHFMRH